MPCEDAEEAPEREPEGAEASPCKRRRTSDGEEPRDGGAALADASAAQLLVTAQSLPSDFDMWVSAALASTATQDVGSAVAAEAFEGFAFTGSLRPARVTPQMKAPAGCSLPDYATHPKGISRMERLRGRLRQIPELQGEQLATMREACRLGREVLDIASRFLRAGVTGDEIDRVVWQACADRRLYPSPLNYRGFPKSVCVSANEVICHGIPDCRAIEEGDVVNLDVSVFWQGFHSDLNETFLIGECDEDSKALVRVAYNSLLAASRMIRPGTFYRDLGGTIQATASEAGFAVVPSFCGHGVGELFHGPPDVPHYRKNKAVGVMKPGHVFTVEPMINAGKSGADQTWPDGWTAVTRTGRRSAQFEHSFLVTEEGFELLTARGISRDGERAHVTAMPELNLDDFSR